MAVELEYKIELSVVGQSGFDQCYLGEYHNGRLFFTCDVVLRVGMTKKNEFSLGNDGLLQVHLSDFKQYYTKKSILSAVSDISDYKHHRAWFAKQDCKFTHALINNIFRKTDAIKLWIHKSWSLHSIKNVV